MAPNNLQIEIEMTVIHEVAVAFAKRMNEMKARIAALRHAIDLCMHKDWEIPYGAWIVLERARKADDEIEERDRAEAEAVNRQRDAERDEIERKAKQ